MSDYEQLEKELCKLEAEHEALLVRVEGVKHAMHKLDERLRPWYAQRLGLDYDKPLAATDEFLRISYDKDKTRHSTFDPSKPLWIFNISMETGYITVIQLCAQGGFDPALIRAMQAEAARRGWTITREEVKA